MFLFTYINKINRKKILLKSFHNINILVFGDGDFSFSRSIYEYNKINNINNINIVSTTLDSKQYVEKIYMNAKDNIKVIENNNGRIDYEIDATNFNFQYKNKFDIIIFNFPHIAGKQNIKKNRLLLNDFLNNAIKLIQHDNNDSINNNKIIISLDINQSGTNSNNKESWDKSWKLTEQAANAGLIVTKIESFINNKYKYIPQGHKGKGWNLDLNNSEIYTLQIPDSKHHRVALQAPLYFHELQVLSNEKIIDKELFVQKSKVLLIELLEIKNFSYAFWSIQLIDEYLCPKTKSYSYGLHIGYCSVTHALNRIEANKIKLYIEDMLPKKLNLIHRRHMQMGLISHSQNWSIAKQLKIM